MGKGGGEGGGVLLSVQKKNCQVLNPTNTRPLRWSVGLKYIQNYLGKIIGEASSPFPGHDQKQIGKAPQFVKKS